MDDVSSRRWKSNNTAKRLQMETRQQFKKTATYTSSAPADAQLAAIEFFGRVNAPAVWLPVLPQ